MKRLVVLFLSIFFICLHVSAGFAEGAREWNVQIAEDEGLDQQIPIDPKIRVGRLDNGLTYYIRQNSKPKNRVVLRLALNAGSILEDDDQQGLAHFVEHMAFNGTENYEKQEIVDYMESVGMQFGPDVNAHTSYDETVYKLNVSTEDSKVVEKAFSILSEWAFRIAFEEEEIDKERGVVIEEWRIRRGADARMREQYNQVLFKDSKYALRSPIGKVEILESFSYDTLKRFYRDWYRPDLMALVIVGDMDPDTVEGHIRAYFAQEPKRITPERVVAPVPDHDNTLYSVVTDPETVNSIIRIYYKHPVQDIGTYQDFRIALIDNLTRRMFNARLDELTREAAPPYIYGGTGTARLVRSKSSHYLAAVVDEKGIERGLEALLTEARRVEDFGFTEGELERAKQDFLKQMEIQYNERDKTDSVILATEYVSNYMSGAPVPGIEFEWNFSRQQVPEITLEDVRQNYNSWLSDSNRVIIVTAPEKENVEIPQEPVLETVLAAVETKAVEPYVDVAAGTELLPVVPQPGSITERQTMPETGVTELRLSNGALVVLKPTEFKNDQILFSAFSRGGTSLADDSEFISAKLATDIVSQSGVGDSDVTQLQKLLSGKSVYVTPYIGSLTEGLSGSATPGDTETMFQLLYLYMTAPREDVGAYSSYMGRLESLLRNQESDPMFLYRKELTRLLTADHLRSRPLTMESLDKADFDTTLRIYRERFQNGGDFTYFFVGAFEPAEIEPLIERYIASLPPAPAPESWVDHNTPLPVGVIQEELRKGLEPQSIVSIVYSGMAKWSVQENFLLDALAEVFSIKLREKIREDEGGTYGVQVYAQLSRYPTEKYTVTIGFGCDPDRAEDLKKIVYQEVEALKQAEPEELYITKVREAYKTTYQENLEKNSYWLEQLEGHYFHQLDPAMILQKNERYDSLNGKLIQETADLYLDQENFVELILYPEK